MPEDVRQALQRWTDSRSRVCREELKVTAREGKKLVTALLSGATPDKSQVDIPFVRNIHRASIYLRWLACSVLAEDYEELHGEEKRQAVSGGDYLLLHVVVCGGHSLANLE